MSGRHRRMEKQMIRLMAKEENMSMHQAKKKFVYHPKQMSFIDDWE